MLFGLGVRELYDNQGKKSVIPATLSFKKSCTAGDSNDSMI
jgi:hypothetical protein